MKLRYEVQLAGGNDASAIRRSTHTHTRFEAVAWMCEGNMTWSTPLSAHTGEVVPPRSRLLKK